MTAEIKNAEEKTKRLGSNRSRSSSGGAQAKHRDEQKIENNIETTSNGDKYKRRFRISEAPHNSGENIIAENKKTPREQIQRYSRVNPADSGGTRISKQIGETRARIAPVVTRARTKKKTHRVPIASPNSLRRSAPKYWSMITVPPAVIPINKLVIVWRT